MNGTIREKKNFQLCAGVTKSFFFLPACLPELILMTWKTSFPFSSWERSTPWLNLHWQLLASTSWFSSWVECCTASPTCLPCGRRPALWPTPWRRYPASPWPCRSCWQSQRTPERKNKRKTCGLFLEKQQKKNLDFILGGWECQWLCNIRCVTTPELGFLLGYCSYFYYLHLLFYWLNCENVRAIWSWHLVLYSSCKWRFFL